VALAVLLFLVPAVPAWVNDDDPERHFYALLSIGPAVLLLVVYVITTYISLRRHSQLHDEEAGEDSWSLAASLVVLGVATVATAIIAEILVGSVHAFADKAGLSDFFVAAVIIAIVGNAAEHGGAVVVAYRGKIKLAAEIALASSAQVAVFLIPAVALLAWAIDPLALSFRPVEIAVLAGSTVLTALLVADGRSSRLKGVILIGAYVVAAAAFFAAGER
jgi:Ca2+:H+ antiporter